MCGIAGCFGVKDEETINQMLDALTHRGPNDRGIHSGDNFTLGHTRLSIVDVATGHQPILTSDGRKGIIANGEIYNFKTLRSDLTSKYTFKTQSDTETVLHLYQEYGPSCVEKLDGMFAFALFDGD
ncbi:MAG: asparagine synthetase B, partial [Desulfobacteraceae bacterium]|nr:asparagine synthetase B [Desulfobacteraceae bacterium]